jgi:hypothetical protein
MPILEISGGINNVQHPTTLPDNVQVSIVNIEFDSKGKAVIIKEKEDAGYISAAIFEAGHTIKKIYQWYPAYLQAMHISKMPTGMSSSYFTKKAMKARSNWSTGQPQIPILQPRSPQTQSQLTKLSPMQIHGNLYRRWKNEQQSQKDSDHTRSHYQNILCRNVLDLEKASG